MKTLGIPPSDLDEPRSLIEATYGQLRRDIIEGRLFAGQRLRVDHLKPMYKVSAGTLREALSLLVSDSLVEMQSQQGFRVVPMSLEDLEDVTRARVLVECEALRQSIESGDDEWEARVVSAFHKLSLAEDRLRDDAVGVFNEWEERNRQFHEALTSACASRWIQRLRTLLYRQSERYRRLSATKGPIPQSVHDEHRQIFELVLARNTERATTSLKAHIHHSLKVIRKASLLSHPAKRRTERTPQLRA